MTWIMFDGKILHPESGNYFSIHFNAIRYKDKHSQSCLETVYNCEKLTDQRFEELKKMLIKQTEHDFYYAFYNQFVKEYPKPKLAGL